MTEVPDILIFIGRFHPLVVHLPIGFLLLAIIMELASRFPQFVQLKPAIGFAWLLGGLSAVLAVAIGYLLSLGGGYNSDTLFWHQWGGIGVALLSLVCYLSGRKDFKFGHLFNARVNLMLTLIVAGLLTVTGHLGGNLTHGSDYLFQYAPNPVRVMVGLPEKKLRIRKKITSLDSADVFEDAIIPIVETKCVSCHNKDKIKGELILTSYKDMLKGGETGAAIVPDNLEASELFRRISLPHDHEEFMPSDGKRPLSDEQVDIIRWWIEHGAKSKGTVASLNPDKEAAELFADYFGMNDDGLLSIDAPSLNEKIMDSLIVQGFQFHYLAEESNLIEANLNISGKKATEVDMNALLQVKEQLVWLQLPNCDVMDQHLESVGQLTNLRKLNLNQNKITDHGLQFLTGLTNLEYLNLYGNNISDESIESIKQLSSLKKLYLRQTLISTETIETLKKERPDLQVFHEMPVVL